MKAFSVVLLLTIFYKSNGQGEFLPDYITPCDFKGDFQSCVKEQILRSLPRFTKGVPELNVPSLEPLNLDDIKIDQNGLKLVFTNSKLNGISNSEMTSFALDIKEEQFTLAFKGNMNLTAKYEVDGRILILPIQGQGDALVEAEGIQVEIRSKLSFTNDTRGSHLKLLQPSYNYDITKTTFTFANLFNGNKLLSEATHKFANENWKQIMDDISPPVIKQIVKTGVKAINKFFTKVPIPRLIKNFDYSLLS